MHRLFVAAVVSAAMMSAAVAGEAFLQPSSRSQQQELVFVQHGFVEPPALSLRVVSPPPLALPVARIDPAWVPLPGTFAPVVARE